MLSAGNDYDSIHAIELLEKIVINDSNILADRAYRAKAIRDYISEQGASYVIPPQRNVSEPWPGGYIKGVIPPRPVVCLDETNRQLIEK